MGCELDELCECEIDTRNLNPILDPLTIMANMSNNTIEEELDVVIIILVNRDIISISNLNNIKMIFLRHQHILEVLMIIIIIIIFIIEFSTSKVDIFINY